MNDPLYISGEWVGYYKYATKPNLLPMHMTLNFTDGRIQGAGIDKSSTFVIEGSYDQSGGRASWLKQYLGRHSVQYEGIFKDGEITGSWSLTQISDGRSAPLRGDFRIWRLPSDAYSGDEPLQSILEKEIRRKI
jgi:hypothetical protein